ADTSEERGRSWERNLRGRAPGHGSQRLIRAGGVQRVERFLDVGANATHAEPCGVQEARPECVVLFQGEELPPRPELLDLRVRLVGRLRAALIEHVCPEQSVACGNVVIEAAGREFLTGDVLRGKGPDRRI